MSSLWTRTWKSTPKVDCGLCGLPNCASFGRAIIFRDLPLSACPFLSLPEYANMRAELQSLLKRAPNLRARLAPEQPEGGVLLTSPCKDTNDRVMAELRVFNGVPTGEPIKFGVFDPMMLCDLMDCLADRYELVKCSRDLGYGRADTGEMSTTVLQDGRINMRRVTDKGEVLALFSQLERALFGAVVCNSCGRDLLSIMVDDSKSDEESEHQILQGGSSFSLDTSQVGVPLAIHELTSMLGERATSVIEGFDTVMNYLKGQMVSLDGATESEDDPYVMVKKTRCQLVGLISDEVNFGKETLILRALGLLRTLESGIVGLEEMRMLLDVASQEEKEWILHSIESLKTDGLPDYELDVKHPRLLHAYGFLRRVDCALTAIQSWSD